MLRAVHLLLALPLFVMVVAVDPRWLRRALEQHHATLFLARDLGDEWQASPADYLDKIFKIPYALRPIGKRADGYLRSLLPMAVQLVPAPAVGTQPVRSTTTEEPATPTIPGATNIDPHALEEKLDTSLWPVSAAPTWPLARSQIWAVPSVPAVMI